MANEIEYLVNYRPDTLYATPAKDGSYATLVGNNEDFLGEIDVSSRCKIAVSAFYVRDKGDYSTFKIVRINWRKDGWYEHSSIKVSGFQLAQIRDFVSIISNLNLSDAGRTRISLSDIHIDALGALLSSDKGHALVKELSTTPELHHDIYAVSAKRAAVAKFKEHLAADLSEGQWQLFFEENPWIFGHGLNYVFLDKVSDKLETSTTGSTFDKHGKRVDGLMLTRAEVSQYVLVEIKKDSTLLLQTSPYRPGCWAVSHELSNAVTQVQKTAFEFSRNRFRDFGKDALGNDTGETAYSIEPKTFLVIGNLRALTGNDDKIACFELYRRNVRSPEIISFDELYHRARCIVTNLSQEPA